MTRAMLLALMLLAAAAPEAAAEVRRLTVTDPRDLGYFIGDTIRRQIDVAVDARFTLMPGALPAPGPLAYWLELNDIGIEERESGGLRIYRIALDYQTFYAPLEPRRMTIPALTLRFADGGKTVFRRVPQFSFLTSPLREIIPPKGAEGSAEADLLAPDPVVRAVSARPAQLALGLAIAAALAALAAIAWRRAWWPFHRRPHRPFSRAARAIRAEENGDAYRADLVRLHRAFDAAAGKRVLADDASAFLRARPEFASESKDIAQFFAASRRAFFSGDSDAAKQHMPPRAVASLAARLGAAERGTS